ncbi:DUF5655 domain-containing protein, partial [Phenylobacterium sp.]|uniref:DUF5655 domain-containing protein n=1 Tax=Phenylobacterium sp. TaxID=1871053 RepID=UPI002811C8CC
PRDEAVLREWLTREGVTGYARMLLVMERFGYPDFMSASAEALIDGQYARRPELRPLYDAVVAASLDAGDVTVQARKTYVSLLTPRRTFARVQAAKDRVDVALRLPADSAGGRLTPSRVHDTMPVQFSLARPEDLDAEALELLKRAYDENI